MKEFALLAILAILPTMTTLADSIDKIALKDIDQKGTTLGAYQGKVRLVVNVASKCGYTKQYATLETIYKKYKDQGLVLLGFPCNQLGAQEPGTAEEIRQFCTLKYNVTFPMFDKIEVNGPKRHALYAALTGKDSPFPGDIQWNFTKFLIGRDGKTRKRFESKVTPDSPEVIAAIETALAAK